jgi:Domain of unknown function (DUF4345)
MAVVTVLLVVLCALFFLWMGVMALLYPAHLLRGFSLHALVADARNEVRAVYGGFGLAMTGVLISGLVWRSHLPGIALTLGASMSGMAAARATSALVDRELGKYPLAFFLVELALAAALLTVFWYGR